LTLMGLPFARCSGMILACTRAERGHMHASWYLEQTIHTERHKDFLRWAEETSKNDRLWAAGFRAAPDLGSLSAAIAAPGDLASRFVRDALSLALRAPVARRHYAPIRTRTAEGCPCSGLVGSPGTHVPPLMIASITETCNLRCKGCYAMAHRHGAENELSTAAGADSSARLRSSAYRSCSRAARRAVRPVGGDRGCGPDAETRSSRCSTNGC